MLADEECEGLELLHWASQGKLSEIKKAIDNLKKSRSSLSQRVEARFADEIGLAVVTLRVPAPLHVMLLSPGPLSVAFTVTLDTTKPWDSVRPATIAGSSGGHPRRRAAT